ncbi:hypothetical protein PG997_013025 [Apiospora hydei]|uniref:Uncharacterized protein n=1 Tax=Apiospora hydei TaxID=1337664 RepID=A0ABR1V522_9PEZI
MALLISRATSKAHELTYGLDTNSGLQYNPDARHGRWRDNGSTVAFQERAACFIDKSSQLPVLQEQGTPVRDKPRGRGLRQRHRDGRRREPFLAAAKPERVYQRPGISSHVRADMAPEDAPGDAALGQHPRKHTHTSLHARIIGTTMSTKAFRDAFQFKKNKAMHELW